MVRNIGDLQVWWVPQVPMTSFFEVEVANVAEGVKVLHMLAEYDLFQLRYAIKRDYCNTGGLRRWCEDCDGDGTPGWEDWCDEDTGQDDPAVWLKAKGAQGAASTPVRLSSRSELATIGWKQEAADLDAVLRMCGLTPENYRTEGGALVLSKVRNALIHNG